MRRPPAAAGFCAARFGGGMEYTMNQNGNQNPQGGQRPASAARPTGSTPRPAGAGQRPASGTRPASSGTRPATAAPRPGIRQAPSGTARPSSSGRQPQRQTPPKSGIRKTTVIGLCLLVLFLVCFTLYSCRFLAVSPDNPPETTHGTEPPVTTVPGTEPPVTNPPVTNPPVTNPPVTEPPVTPPADATVVILDPGHGFFDGGCSNDALGNWIEKTLTMDICRRIEPILKASGIYVLYTHDGETFPSNSEIDAIAAENGFAIEPFVRKLIQDYGFDKQNNPVDENSVWKAFSGNLLDTGTGKNIFNVYERAYYVSALAKNMSISAMVSVHVNSVDVTNPNIDASKFHGMTVSYCTSNDQRLASMKLQKSVSDELAAAFPEKRLIRYADPWYDSLVICKYSAVPTILIETGYATDPTDAADFCDEAYRQKLAETIAAGIIGAVQ